MITTAFISMAYYILGFFISLFPVSSGFPSDVSAAFTWIGGYAGMLDPLVPMSTLASTVSIVIAVELIIFGYKILSWIFSKVPLFGK